MIVDISFGGLGVFPTGECRRHNLRAAFIVLTVP
jgi:hypothetical protein